MRTTWIAALSPLALVACGCGGSTNTTTDAGAADAAPLGAADGGAILGLGEVAIVYEATAGSSSGGLSATFQTASASACTQRAVGACDVLRCDTGAAPSVANVSAGTISIAKGSSSAMIAPASDGTYSFSGALPAYAAGDFITVSASGGTIPAFSTSVVFGPPVMITTPSGTAVIDHTKDLAIAWTGGGSSQVVVKITEGVPDRTVLVRCAFDGTAGSATIPAGALSDLEPAMLGSGASQGDFSIYSAGVSDVSPGGLRVIVFAGPGVFSELPQIQ